MANSSLQITYYELLGNSPGATHVEVKEAYHRTLLSFHPDKQNSRHNTDFDAAVVKDAYLTLSDPISRTKYDETLRHSIVTINTPRPAQIISLDDFEEIDDGDVRSWSHVCRCGGTYVLKEKDLDEERHLIACGSCSEAVYVGDEILEDDEN